MLSSQPSYLVAAKAKQDSPPSPQHRQSSPLAGLLVAAHRARQLCPLPRALAPTAASQASCHTTVVADGWHQVINKKKRRVRHPRPLPPPPPRPVLVDLVGRCFNCFATDHVAATFRNPSHCLRCQQEGHQARHCKRPPYPFLESSSRSHFPQVTRPPPQPVEVRYGWMP